MPDLALPAPPEPLDVVAPHDADELLQAADDELALLRLELAEIDEELDGARRRAQAVGANPQAIAGATTRLDELTGSMRSEAELHAAAVTAPAAAAAQALIDRAHAHTASLRNGTAPPTALPPVAAPMAQMATGAYAVPPAMWAPQGWMPVPPGWVPASAVPTDEDEPDHLEAPDPYAKTLGLLQVVSWSILVAVVLIVLLAWFA